jgi:glycosyltransferase involved in cell wall biosynthesis
MKLSIVTINYNNAEGLRKTLASVASQTYRDIEHIIVDGASTDGSVDVIKEYENQLNITHSTINLLWDSEPDNGIYNAMNKGIEIALGRRVVNSLNRSELAASTPYTLHPTPSQLCEHYIQILNSGDLLAAHDVTERMMAALQMKGDGVELLYGNMVKYDYTNNRTLGKSTGVEYSLRQYYTSTMNHDCCYIRRDLFETYGLYDESLKIVSDWKWFLQTIGLGKVKPIYVDIDVTIFDASGISETNLALRNQERRQVLAELMPPAVLADYDAHAFEMEQMKRLRRWKLYPLVYFIERVLFKLEKWGMR